MLDINGIINFGNKISKKKDSMGSDSWRFFVVKYFQGNFDSLNKFIFLSKHSVVTKEEFDKNPQLPLNSLHKRVQTMSKRKDFEIEYQKEIDRCKKKMAIYSANGSMANDVVALIRDRVEKAEIARQSRDTSGMVSIYNEMKVLRT